jgi:NDP-sugar pyrophosphorylase family protein
MKAMLLAAGLGTRLRPLTDNFPKCMVPIAGKPVLEYNLEWLRRYGIHEVLINLHYLPHVVKDYFGDGSNWGMKITYSLEKEVLGTAGGVKKGAWFFDKGAFFVWYGDNLSTCDLNKMYDFHQTKAGIATIALYQREDVTHSGIVRLDGNDRILCYLEKPSLEQAFSHWVNAGIFILEPELLGWIPVDTYFDFSHDVFPAMLSEGQLLYGYRMSEGEQLWWIDTRKDLERTQNEFERRRSP